MDNCNFVKVIGMNQNRDRLTESAVLTPFDIAPSSRYKTRGILKFGLKEKRVVFVPSKTPNVIVVSKDIMEDLNIYEGMNVCAIFKDGVMKLGPVVAIFVNPGAYKDILDGYASNKTMKVKDAAAETHTFLYYFTVDCINWSDRTVEGVLFDSSTNSWKSALVPLPDVLYDRGGGFGRIALEKAMDIREQLDHFIGIKKINAQHYFDKWDLHKKLSLHDEMKRYLPETVLLKDDGENLEYMLKKYDVLYIKSCTGSNGREVMRVRKSGQSKYEYDYYRHGIVKSSIYSLDSIIRVARNFIGRKRTIIQQGIDTLTYKGNKIDIRVLTQRDGNGKWRITSIPVRFAVNDCPVTSTKSGSEVYQFEHAFHDILNYDNSQVNEIRNKIYKLMRTAVDCIQNEYGTFGELGIDIAVDNNLDLWFIEANSKPAKDTILIAGPEEAIRNAYLRPFEYARYLASFQ